jgi:hypothetical protein
MLTSGASPVSMDKFSEYAYVNGNDWKDKTDSEHIRHPLLAASRRKNTIGLQNVLSGSEEYRNLLEQLDPLDKVSWQIDYWYKSNKDLFMRKYITAIKDIKEFLRVNNEYNGTVMNLLKELEAVGMVCIENVGDSFGKQNTEKIIICKNYLNELKKSFEGCDEFQNLICELEKVVKPVSDSYRDSDFKQYDRDLVYSVIDMIV